MSKRNYYFDNVKFVLIVFVVFGHLLRSYIEDDQTFFALYATIYLFHMPAFILISGFFSKSFYKPGYLKKITQKILLPFIIFQVLYSIFYFFLRGEETFELNMLIPEWSLWFLLSLFFWNVLLVLLVKWLKLKPALLLTVAFAIGITIGCIDTQLNILSFARTFIFFPFFLIGFYLKKEHFQILFTIPARVALLLSTTAVLYASYVFAGYDQDWLFGSVSFQELGATNLEGMTYRFIIYVLNFIMIAALLAFVPHKNYFFTAWGRNTLYVYLLHGFFIQTFRESAWEESAQSILLLLAAAIILAMFLSSKAVTALTQPLIELKWTRLKDWLGSRRRSKDPSS